MTLASTIKNVTIELVYYFKNWIHITSAECKQSFSVV